MEQIAMIDKSRAALDEDACWRVVIGEAEEAKPTDFYVGVLTTGIFCRPDCKARRPKRENVRFFRSTQEALRAGLRPCKRCRPMGTAPEAESAARIAAACRRIEAAENTPSLAELAEEAGLSPFHFHRLFKAATGLTPKAYALAVKQNRMRDSLTEAGSVTEAIYAAGYSSSSRFYEADGRALGMTPSRYRAGGKDTLIHYAIQPCWLGLALIAATENGICALFFDDDEEALVAELRRRFPAARIERGGKALDASVRKVLRALDEPALAAELPLDIRGTAFQQRVWEALRAVPAGRTATYSDIARQLGEPRAVRAVAGACAANPVALAIPCHRIVGKSGSLTGYRWGIERKRQLLKRESSALGGVRLLLPSIAPPRHHRAGLCAISGIHAGQPRLRTLNSGKTKKRFRKLGGIDDAHKHAGRSLWRGCGPGTVERRAGRPGPADDRPSGGYLGAARRSAQGHVGEGSPRPPGPGASGRRHCQCARHPGRQGRDRLRQYHQHRRRRGRDGRAAARQEA